MPLAFWVGVPAPNMIPPDSRLEPPRMPSASASRTVMPAASAFRPAPTPAAPEPITMTSTSYRSSGTGGLLGYRVTFLAGQLGERPHHRGVQVVGRRNVYPRAGLDQRVDGTREIVGFDLVDGEVALGWAV